MGIKLIYLILSLLYLFCNLSISSHAANSQEKIVKIEKKQPKENSVPDVSFGSEESLVQVQEVLIPVNVRNDFDEEIKIKFDTNREYPIGPHESITLGKKKPGRYTLTIYNKNGEFVDNLTRNIDNKNKFVLNKDTVSNSEKITGLSAGQKVAITAGAVGAAALGGALLNKALENNEQQILPNSQDVVSDQINEQLAVAPPAINLNAAFAPGGKPFKFLNLLYPQATIIVEDVNGNPIGSNWVIPKATTLQKPQPLIYDGAKITINSEQKIKAVIPSGHELQRYAFELEMDSVDGSYVWVLR